MPYDVFISYAHNDNLVTPPEKYGWVDNFHIALYNYLTGKLGLGRTARIWRDETELEGNNLLDEALAEGVGGSLIFIPILSPNYLASRYCLQELTTFCSQPDVFHDARSRIFPVVKLPITAPPAPLEENLLKFKFYNVDSFGKPSEELDPSFGGEFRNKFNQKVNDLAREIAAFIISNLPPPNPVPPDDDPPVIEVADEPPRNNGNGDAPPKPPVPKIYLAEPSPDMFDKYLEIKRDLEERRNHGTLKFEFLPHPLPEDPTQIADKPDEAEDYKRLVRNDVNECRLTIHLIGKKHNNAPFGSNQSYLELTMETAAERDGEANFNRLVWIPKNIFTEAEAELSGSERHKAFVAKVRQTGVGGDGLMQDSFESFKSRIIEIIENKPKVSLSLPPPDETWFYVICDKSDIETVGKVEELLQNSNYAIFSSADYLKKASAGDPEINVFENHNEYLTRCNAVVIFWDKAGIPWVRKNVFDLQGSPALRKGQPIDFQAVVIDGDLKDEDKVRFRTPPPKNCYKINYQDFSAILTQANSIRRD